MSGPVSKVIPDDALFGDSGKIATIPPINKDLEQMAPEASAAVATSTPRAVTYKKGLPEWGPTFLQVLPEVNGHLVKGAAAVGLTLSAIYEARKVYPALASAINDIKALVDLDRLECLEAQSFDQAEIDKNTTERIFHLNALNSPKYRPKAGGNQLTSVHITMGVLVPASPDFSQAQEIPAAAATVSEPSEEF